MTGHHPTTKAGGARSRLFYYNAGFLRQKRLQRILSLAGYDLRLGKPTADDLVAVWGNADTAHRGHAVAEARGCGLLRVEDAFLRSIHPGRAGEPPLGLLLDRSGLHFDPATPSDLEQLLASHPLDDSALMRRARRAIARLQDAHLSKYNAYSPQAPVPDPGYVLVIDQARGDASVRASTPFEGTDHARFQEMLYYAQDEHPGARIIIKSHPEDRAGHRPGYYSAADAQGRVEILDTPVSPWALLEGAIAVYTVSSQMGFEAILCGHKPRIFGQPFYAGWGLSEDEFPITRRQRSLTRAQLFAAAMILYPTWYSPHHDRLCELEEVIDALEAETRAWQQDRAGWIASGMRLWKRHPLQTFFGRYRRLRFSNSPKTAKASGRNWMIWAGRTSTRQSPGAHRVEDGFLRSRGLGADLIPPLSLVVDRQGIYYDPHQPSDLEDLIAARATLTPEQQQRAETLTQRLVQDSLSKYNLGGTVPDLPEGHRVLVVGQVADDASVRLGCEKIATNADLLRAARAANPGAVLIYKPHPDVEAGLRDGSIAAEQLADVVVPDSDPMALLDMVHDVWTMTSLMGFEALLRGVKVTTVGAPFYAGWGLTTDLGAVPVARRRARPSLMGLVHAALIDYPRYVDPVSGLPCQVELVVERLAKGDIPAPGTANRTLAKLQGLLATYAHLWR
ncbi:capsular polysaccharide biosynthesis protein [Phaeobacter sp. HS012]|uniref:capsular polysaccharide biosynthesis protein n=1 Tax=unclassified Phaeobacter TaxID=2621772 RepID=UPI001B3810F1|nr:MULTISPECIES: capsular polysaccharide biosynthesis protein [unclassified Phaeobacter]MBQ4806036.1 capsular polysaccharide biosynthesis protein [Phaeobacter sp. HS012]MBQ4880886.1 capsular polysaccharide biosynthesis protein [Phaeobacter sp. HS011]